MTPRERHRVDKWLVVIPVIGILSMALDEWDYGWCFISVTQHVSLRLIRLVRQGAMIPSLLAIFRSDTCVMIGGPGYKCFPGLFCYLTALRACVGY
jgi:hypothetical protein